MRGAQMRGWTIGACVVGVTAVVMGAAGCSSGPTRDEFVVQMMAVNITPNLSADQAAKLRNVWGCAYDHLDDDSTKERVMKLTKGEQLAREDSAALSTIITNQCKTEMEAGTSPTGVTTTVPGDAPVVSAPLDSAPVDSSTTVPAG